MRHKRMPYYLPAHQDIYMLFEAMLSNARTVYEWENAPANIIATLANAA
jgi:hypothetical protein